MIYEVFGSKFDEVYEIMEKAFPEIEIREKEVQFGLFEIEEFHTYAIGDESKGEINGFVNIWEFENCLYIDHFAVKDEFRGDGLGGKVLEHILGSTNKFVILEVELPDGDLEKRRIAFYERYGFKFNDYYYMQPPMKKGNELFPLRIMTYPDRVDEIEFNKYKEMLHKDVYGRIKL